MCLEVDGYEFHDQQAQTHSSVHSLNPHWDQVRHQDLSLSSLRILFKRLRCLAEKCYNSVFGKLFSTFDDVLLVLKLKKMGICGELLWVQTASDLKSFEDLKLCFKHDRRQ